MIIWFEMQCSSLFPGQCYLLYSVVIEFCMGKGTGEKGGHAQLTYPAHSVSYVNCFKEICIFCAQK